MKRGIKLIIAPLGGFVGSILSIVVLTNFLQYIDEYTHPISVVSLIILGLSVGISIDCIFLVREYFNRFIENSYKKVFVLYLILTFLLFTGIFLALIFFGESNLLAWLFLSLSFSLWIYIGFFMDYYSTKKSIVKTSLCILGGTTGGILAGIFINLAYLLRINFSIDEGYFLFTTFLLSLIGAIIGMVISISIILYKTISKDKLVFSRSLISNRSKIISILLAFSLLFSVTAYNYWETMGLNEKNTIDTNSEKLFTCYPLANKTEMNNASYYTKKDIISFLESKPNKTIDTCATLYLLSQDEKWANNFKESLLDEAHSNRFIGTSGSVKAWQYEAMIRAYYYLLLTEDNPALFNESEKNLILDWFKEINEQTFKIGWVDYIYGFLFKKIPGGPYKNQEIGVGLLSVLSELLKEKYPDLSKKNIKYINNFGVGWKGNFRNPDDGIVYHQHIWIKNAYMMAKYGGHEEYLLNNNTRNSFEWILLQWPSNGMSSAYNVPASHTPFDIIVMGARLFHDGKYLWLAQQMLRNEIENPDRKIDYIIGLNYWEENINPVKPNIGSCYIQGTTGIAQNLGSLKPDKIVFRDGWENDSLYALLNLRFSGWHSYKATNSIISIMYREPFVVEELPLKYHPWLPEGKADFRDKKIDRTMLNAFQIELTGLEKLIYKLTGFGSEWSQDPPRFAEVLSFNSTSTADFSKTRISDWHGWTHDRVSILVKGDYFVVLDYAKGDNERKVALTWHLKGDAEFSSDKIKLTQGNYTLAVYYPHSNNWYQTKIVHRMELYPHAGDIHDPDIELLLISEKKSEVGFTTLFYPEKDNINYKVEKTTVLNNKNQLAYPKALGIKIIKPNQIDIIGANFDHGKYLFGDISTDAATFILQKKYNTWIISFNEAEYFEVISNKKPLTLEVNNETIIENEGWNYSNGVINIKSPSKNGDMIIEFEEFREVR